MKKAIFCLVLGLFLLTVPVLAKIPNDPGYQSQMWGQVGAPQAWDISTGSRKVVVAIVDTGADTWHGDLNKNIWVNTKEIPDNGRDDDHNGYIDDINGWNFIEDNDDVRTSVFGISDDSDVVNHGTLLAGLVGAVGDNNLDGTGMNWTVQIMALRAVRSDGKGSISDMIDAVNYAADNGASVISLSLVTDKKDENFKKVLRAIYDRGILVVAAAGNERTNGKGDLDKNPLYPVCLDEGDEENWILGVSAVNSADQLSYFANFGTCVDILAPGEEIASTERYAPSYNYTEEFGGGWNGTSFASPIVAGAAALVKSIHPEWGAREITQNLLENADDIEYTNPAFIGRLGYGRLNIGRAMASAEQNKFLGDYLDSVYFYSGNDIYEYGLRGAKPVEVAAVQEAKILDIASADVNNDDHKEIVLLISRSPYYYIRILSAGGEFINEFSLQGVSSPTRTAGKIELYANNNNDDFITVPVYNTNKKETTFLKYNIFGEKVDEFVYRGSVLGWDVLGSGDSIAVAVKNKTDLVLKNIDWAGNEMSKINIGKANSVDDLKTGIDPQTGLSKVFVIYRQNASVLQTSTDFHNGSKKTVGIIGKNKEKWHLLVGSFDKGDYLGVLRFQLSGGPFPLLREDGTWQKNVSMPKIIGGVE